MFARVASYEIDLENFGPVAEWFNQHGEALNQQLAGYLGSMTLIDRDNSTMIGIGVYDSEDNARKVDAVMDQRAPEEMPDDLREILMRGTRTSRGVYEVVQSAGQLAGG
jgi:hypothetical protein